MKISPDFIDFLRPFYNIVRQSFLHSNCPQDNLERNGNGQKLEKENEIMRKKTDGTVFERCDRGVCTSHGLRFCGIRQHGGDSTAASQDCLLYTSRCV